MSDAQMLSMYKSQAVSERHEVERIVELNDRFRDHTEGLAKVLAGQMNAARFEPENLALRKELESEEHRFMEWRDGDRVWNAAIYTLVFEPGVYRDSPQVFAPHALEASIVFDKMIRDALRELYKTNDHIAALSDDATALRITRVEPAERPKLSQRLKSWSDTAEIGITWGGRLISVLPHIQELLKKL